jgi:hypothetical protein
MCSKSLECCCQIPVYHSRFVKFGFTIEFYIDVTSDNITKPFLVCVYFLFVFLTYICFYCYLFMYIIFMCRMCSMLLRSSFGETISNILLLAWTME